MPKKMTFKAFDHKNSLKVWLVCLAKPRYITEVRKELGFSSGKHLVKIRKELENKGYVIKTESRPGRGQGGGIYSGTIKPILDFLHSEKIELTEKEQQQLREVLDAPIAKLGFLFWVRTVPMQTMFEFMKHWIMTLANNYANLLLAEKIARNVTGKSIADLAKKTTNKEAADFFESEEGKEMIDSVEQTLRIYGAQIPLSEVMEKEYSTADAMKAHWKTYMGFYDCYIEKIAPLNMKLQFRRV